MARIVLGSYMVRYPLGGMMSWVLQWLVGFDRLGHEIYFVEKAGYPDACYDPVRDVMTDDCAYGMGVVEDLLARFGLDDRVSFVDHDGRYHGLSRDRVEAILASADVFIDMGTHGSWLSEAQLSGTRVLVDGEPGFTQMKMANGTWGSSAVDAYDHFFTTGQNIGTGASSAPSAGKSWRHVFHPVVTEIFDGLVPTASEAAPTSAQAFNTVMNWQSYEPIVFEGETFGHKDVEFERFMNLPDLVPVDLEVAVSGSDVPRQRLAQAGWRVRDAHEVTISFDTFRDYIEASAGEFSVCKSGYVRTNGGWFSDRSAAYLAAGRPVVMQETGFSAHLPTGLGLFAVTTIDEAAAALAEIRRDHRRHSLEASRIARDFLDSSRVLARFLDEL